MPYLQEQYRTLNKNPKYCLIDKAATYSRISEAKPILAGSGTLKIEWGTT